MFAGVRRNRKKVIQSESKPQETKQEKNEDVDEESLLMNLEENLLDEDQEEVKNKEQVQAAVEKEKVIENKNENSDNENEKVVGGDYEEPEFLGEEEEGGDGDDKKYDWLDSDDDDEDKSNEQGDNGNNSNFKNVFQRKEQNTQIKYSSNPNSKQYYIIEYNNQKTNKQKYVSLQLLPFQENKQIYQWIKIYIDINPIKIIINQIFIKQINEFFLIIQMSLHKQTNVQLKERKIQFLI